METPLISIIIPVYNAQLYINEAIESVIQQSYNNIQIIITDDGSTDNSVAIIKALNDQRIEIYETQKNEGQANRLNFGIEKAKGDFICIMHADDVMVSTKLEKQLKFLLQNPQIGICGCNILLMGTQSGEIKYPQFDQECKNMLLSAPPFAHSAILAKKEVFSNLNTVYYQHLVPAEDYDLWVRLATQNTFANIQEPLLKYRIHAQQIGTLKKDREAIVLSEIRKKIISLFFKINEKRDIDICFKTLFGSEKENISYSLYGIKLMWKQNKKLKFFSSSKLKGRFKHLLYLVFKNIPVHNRMLLVCSDRKSVV